MQAAAELAQSQLKLKQELTHSTTMIILRRPKSLPISPKYPLTIHLLSTTYIWSISSME